MKIDSNPQRRFGIGWALAVAALVTALFFAFRGWMAEATLMRAYLLAMSLIVAGLIVNLWRQARVARQGERRANALFELMRELSATRDLEQISEIGVRHLRASFQGQARLLFPGADGGLASLGRDVSVDVMANARRVFERDSAIGDEEAGAGSGIRYLRLRAATHTRGVLVLFSSKSPQSESPERERMLQTCAELIAQAVERVHARRNQARRSGSGANRSLLRSGSSRRPPSVPRR